MTRTMLSRRRPLTMAAAALAGLATAFAVASPALATDPTPSPATTATAQPTATAEPTVTAQPTVTPAPEGPTCVTAADARYTHTFDGPAGTASITLTNGPLCAGEKQELALVSYVTPSAAFAVPQYVLDKSVQAFTGVADGELGVATLDFEVEVPACYTQVDFVFGSTIIDPLTDTSDRYGDRKVGSSSGIGARSEGPRAWYNGGKGTCEAAPEVIAASDCDGTVELTLVNRTGNASADFVVTGGAGFAKTVTVALRAIETVALTAEQAKEITVAAKGMQTWTGGWEKPQDCQEPEVGEPEAGYTFSCDEMTFQIVNPANGASLASTFTPSTGTAKTVTVEPGTTETVTFPAGPGFSVTVTGDLDSGGPLAWEQPADCDKGGEGGGDPSLPVTGAAAGGIAAGAVALLALGAVLFVMARRRRVRFTA
ncbi:cell wall anchor protein [Micromonospora endolithica]|uniref:Cell wall anchor protein n=1 Tax=Micromonospora endolithica TaxID=230091 RepID=A0A3A9ZPD8_9ACTN|nr:cell wall anchor protein [Micromonospora endolithica]RKN49357.1 cell wall anchor protein [Micromonospora endolithica]TWJ23545.1 hypothetical protein JD76_03681 [Micromonospora endolithica]